MCFLQEIKASPTPVTALPPLEFPEDPQTPPSAPALPPGGTIADTVSGIQTGVPAAAPGQDETPGQVGTPDTAVTGRAIDDDSSARIRSSDLFNPPSESDSGGSGTAAGPIIGGVVAALVLVLAGLIALFIMKRNKRRARSSANPNVSVLRPYSFSVCVNSPSVDVCHQARHCKSTVLCCCGEAPSCRRHRCTCVSTDPVLFYKATFCRGTFIPHQCNIMQRPCLRVQSRCHWCDAAFCAGFR